MGDASLSEIHMGEGSDQKIMISCSMKEKVKKKEKKKIVKNIHIMLVKSG